MGTDLLCIAFVAPTPVLMAAWLAARAGRTWPPSLRNALWRLALAGCWLAPAVALAARAAEVSLPWGKGGLASFHGLVARAAWPMVGLWLLGMGVGLGRLLRDALAVRLLLRTTSLLDDPEAWGFVARCGDRIGLPTLPFVARSDQVRVPLVVGWRGARLVLPETFGPVAEEQHAALAHELAHVRRGDPWSQLLARLTRVVWWWHPLVHLLARELVVTAEEACDDWAVSVTGERRGLACLLVSLASDAGSLGLPLAERRTGLARRVERLLAEDTTPQTRVPWPVRAGAALAVTLMVTLGASLGAWAATPEYLLEDQVSAAGVKVDTTVDVEDVYSWAIGQVCAEAAGTYRELLGLPVPETVHVRISVTDTWFANVVTDRDTTVFVNYNRSGNLGDRLRGRPKQIGILCHAVGELFNRHRVPGLERYVAYVLAVPRVAEALGNQAWPAAYDYKTVDGLAAFHPRTTDQRFLAVHPDWAAAAALYHVADALGVDWLGDQLRRLDCDGAEALARIRAAAVAEEPALDERFAAWDEATRDRREPDGSLLLNSFENDAQLALMPDVANVEVSSSDEWATDGERCLKVTFQGADGWSAVRVLDEDWLYHDWTAFHTLEMDARNLSNLPVRVTLSTNDAPDWGHGWLYGWCDLKPGETRHYVLPLHKADQVAGQTDTKYPRAVYWEGQSRLDEIATLSLQMPPEQQRPVTVCFDDLRLRP